MLLSFIHNRQSLFVVGGPDLSTRLLQWWYGGYPQSSCAHIAITAPWVPLSLCSLAILILSALGLHTLCHYLFELSAVRSFAASLLRLANITPPSQTSPQMWHPWFSAEKVCVCVGGGCCTQEGLGARTVAGDTLYSVIVTVVVGYIYGLTSTWSSIEAHSWHTSALVGGLAKKSFVGC